MLYVKYRAGSSCSYVLFCEILYVGWKTQTKCCIGSIERAVVCGEKYNSPLLRDVAWACWNRALGLLNHLARCVSSSVKVRYLYPDSHYYCITSSTGALLSHV